MIILIRSGSPSPLVGEGVGGRGGKDLSVNQGGKILVLDWVKLDAIASEHTT